MTVKPGFAGLLRPVLLLLTLIVGMAACSRHDRLQTGDLIFVGIPADYSLDDSSMDGAITAATGSGELNLIHVAIADVDDDGEVWIIDATIKHGVDRHPLGTFLEDFTLRDGSSPVFVVRRLRDSHDAARYVESARSFVGLPYDCAFLPDNGAMYCTELVYESYTDGDGKPLFHAAPMNFLGPDGEYPQYWKQLFARIGQEIPQGVDGTNPQAMAQEELLVPVNVNITK